MKIVNRGAASIIAVQSVHLYFTGIYTYVETDRYDWNINK